MRVWSEKEENFQYPTGPQRLDTIHLVVEVYMSGIQSHFIQSKKTLVLPALLSLEDSPYCRIVCLHCASLYIEFSNSKTELKTGKSFIETASKSALLCNCSCSHWSPLHLLISWLCSNPTILQATYMGKLVNTVVRIYFAQDIYGKFTLQVQLKLDN